MRRSCRVIAGASVALLTLVACGSDSKGTSGANSTVATPGSGAASAIEFSGRYQRGGHDFRRHHSAGRYDADAADPKAAAAERLAVHYAGTDRALPDSAPKPAAGKNVWVIPCATAAEGCAIPAKAISDAGGRMGWKVTVSDGGFDPTVQSNGIRSAIADHADAIVLIAVDCPNVKTAAQEAKDAGIKLYSDFSLDCNEGSRRPSAVRRVGDLRHAAVAVQHVSP